MLGQGAKLVIGADPSQFFLSQFQLMKHYAGGDLPIYLLPLKGEELPAFTQEYRGKGFDTVFSMGVLYHRQSPITHLQELRYFLRSGGELILETLIIEGDQQTVLIPENRYAKMRNVWFIPSPDLLKRMLQRAGFINIRVVDINQTSTGEQRVTSWMSYESLADFLDPNDHNKTIEGYPAPKRAMLVCNVP
jgi:tRNA (mo5U34)-methyltransferase